MKIKIVADSSANMYTLSGGVDFASAPLTIRTAEKEFVDTENLDILEMVDYLAKYKGKKSRNHEKLQRRMCSLRCRLLRGGCLF